ncbi:MAG: ABC transporter ATP-binding protein [Candidatus Omnitrophica bacterium]|nr:ABC transporter ATP-binding protein [Candidatus Omnitrophota bacterium]
MPDPALELRNLSVRFSSTTAVDGLNFPVAEGAFTALVGASGSGKSVTALAVCRLLRGALVHGEVWYRGADGRRTDLLKMDESGLLAFRGKEISYVFQDPVSSLNPVMRVGEQILEACLAHSALSRAEANRRALDLLESLRVREPARVCRAYPHELSGGLCQRAMLAAALIARPRVLIADEPTTALDALSGKEVLDLLAEIREKEGLAILFITHDLALAERHADFIGVMDAGRVIEVLEKGNGFAANHPQTRRLFNASLSKAVPKTPIEG